MFRKSLTKKLITDLVMSVLLLAVCILVGTYAWLAKNVTLRASNPNMQIIAADIVVKNYTVYQYNEETNKVDDVTTPSGVYTMTQYDSIFLERNNYTPLLFVTDVGNASPGNMTVYVYCDSLHTDPTAHFTSNVVCVKAASGNTINSYALEHGGHEISYEASEENRMYLFDNAAQYFKTDNNKGQFCSVTKNGTGLNATYNFSNKRTAITFNINLTEDDLITNPDGSKTAKIYLIVTYAPELVEAQQVQFFSDIEIQGQYNEPIKYENDITTIYFASEE